MDVSELVIGAAVRVSDIALPADVTTELDPESVVVAGQPPRVQAAEEAPAEGEEAEGEAAGGEEGAASAEASGGGGESGGES